MGDAASVPLMWRATHMLNSEIIDGKTMIIKLEPDTRNNKVHQNRSDLPGTEVLKVSNNFGEGGRAQIPLHKEPASINNSTTRTKYRYIYEDGYRSV